MKFARFFPVALLCLTLPSIAQESDPNLASTLDRVSSAYNGEMLRTLRSYEIIEQYLSPNVGQSWHPSLVDIGRRNFRIVRDLEHNRLYQETWFLTPNGRLPNINIVDGETGWTLDLRAGSVGELVNTDPYALTGGTIRTSDTLLARELLIASDSAEYLESSVWQNRVHDLVSIPLPLSPDLTLYIDRESGVISRMTRENPVVGLLDYVFTDHHPSDGSLAASSVSFFIAGELNLAGLGRQTRLNQNLDDSIFKVPAGLESQGEQLDDSEIVVNQLSDVSYHIGQNGAYSVFVNSGEQLIAVGAYAGFADRLSKYREVSNNHRPLSYLIVTHHHQDHIGGIDDAVAIGARLVTVDDNVDALREASSLELTNTDIQRVMGQMTLGKGDGEIQLHDVSTTHAASNLLFYLPAARVLFLADHFGSGFVDSPPAANENTMSMFAALDPLALKVKQIATAHSARIFTNKEFESAVEAFRAFECPDDRPLCSL